MNADVEIVRAAMVCDEHQGDECPCLEWAPEAHAALNRLASLLPPVTVPADVPAGAAQPDVLDPETVAHMLDVLGEPRTDDNPLILLAASHELLRARLDEARRDLDRTIELAETAQREREDYRLWNERVRVCADHAQDIAAPVGDCLICTVESLRAEARP